VLLHSVVTYISAGVCYFTYVTAVYVTLLHTVAILPMLLHNVVTSTMLLHTMLHLYIRGAVHSERAFNFTFTSYRFLSFSINIFLLSQLNTKRIQTMTTINTLLNLQLYSQLTQTSN